MESSLVTRKRTRTSSKISIASPPTFALEKLPKEIMVNICQRLPRKDLSKTICLSKPLREKMTCECLPLIEPLAPNYYGLLLQFTPEKITQRSSGLSMVFNESNDEDGPSFGPYRLLTRCARIMQCEKITSDMLLDCCNGLLLFCYHGKVEHLHENSYYFYVINPMTKQCIAVQKQNPQTHRSICAALAYDPSESSYFKIVQFQGPRQLNIFHAGKGLWAIVKYKLPPEVTRAIWETKSVYNNGALYRISHSGHLVKFQIDSDDQDHLATAINLPENYSSQSMCTIGIRNKKITFASISGMSLLIWELKDQVDGGKDAENWSLLSMVECNNFRSINCGGQVLAIHPYREMVFLLEQPYVYCAYYSIDKVTYKRYSIPTNSLVTAFPILECSIPFTCCLNNTESKTFHHLTFQKQPRGKRKSKHSRAFRIYPSNYVHQ